MKKVKNKIKSKKYLYLALIAFAIIVGVLFEEQISGLYNIKQVETGELSSSPLAGVHTYNLSYKASAGLSTSRCNNKTYTPTFSNYSSNVFGPFPYPTEMNFKGNVDDNLKVNGQIVGQPGCSHKHSLDYSQKIPAGQSVRIEVVDNYGVDVALSGTLTFKREVSSVEKVDLKMQHYRGQESIGASGSMQDVSGSYTKGTKLKITAKPNKGSMVVWSAPCTNAGKACTATLNDDTEIYYTFVKKKSFWSKCIFVPIINPVSNEYRFELKCDW